MSECISAEYSQRQPDRSRYTTDFILSACGFAAAGLSALLQEGGHQVVTLQSEGEAATLLFPSGAPAEVSRLVVWLPAEPSPMLQTLMAVISALNARHVALKEVVILSSLNPAWLWYTLLRQVSGRQRLACVFALNARLPYRKMKQSLLASNEDCFPVPLRELAREEERAHGAPPEGLTPREMSAMLALFEGSSVQEQSFRERLSPKTLYSQRVSGLRKLASQLPSLSHLVPGGQKVQTGRGLQGLSVFGQAFSEAVHRGRVYPVFQPVMNRDMAVVGCEVLARWSRDGREVPPAEFLPSLSTRTALVSLTAFMLNAAILQINRFKGTVCFLVSVPPSLSGSGALMQMVSKALGLLGEASWSARLILEISGRTPMPAEGVLMDNLRSLRDRGVKIFMGDCFAEDNMFFPVRRGPFSGYRLDVSLVSKLEHDEGERQLTEGMAHYCRLTGRVFIADGVDTPAKLAIIKALGVEYYQGSLISPPVQLDELAGILR